MDPRPIAQIAVWLGLGVPAGDVQVQRIVTDSRIVKPGDLFVALHGEKFDGHAFLAAAKAAGAAGAVVSRPDPALHDWPQLCVADTLAALQGIAAAYRATLPLQTVSVTGSNGKTSTKEMLAAVLGVRYRAGKTLGNLNNHIGVPLTLLSFGSEHELGVVEMGTNHPGELKPLAALARSAAAVITNIGVAHIGHFHSQEAIAVEKASVAEAIGPEGFVVLNANDRFSPCIAARCRAAVTTAGLGRGEVQARDLRFHDRGVSFTLADGARAEPVELPVPGEHMVANAALAVAAGLRFGVTLAEAARALAGLQLPGGRFRVQKLREMLIVDDAYNANPDSMVAALHTVARMQSGRRKVAVLGRMAELGEESEAGHRRVGRSAAEAGFECVITVGHEAAEIGRAAAAAGSPLVRATGSHDEAVQLLRSVLRAGDVVLVKGSASAEMGRVIWGLEALEKEGKWRAP
ncbi:MAG: UDP-N-acetylmuramoyl-tripeptide--D-alanyl-D-alanine ligase [Verrucomicrobia bacterium]|nr:UDP-N-acetylmuramoyl-tripeptide--D-alanyl-D-alanine ligase [Verrucomicrobiota bacterium]